MDVFALRDRLIREYEQYVRGFISIREPRTFAFVDDYFAAGRLWPEPLIQINPAFQRGPTIDDLVARGTLHPSCATIFRRRDQSGTSGNPNLQTRSTASPARSCATSAPRQRALGLRDGRDIRRAEGARDP